MESQTESTDICELSQKAPLPTTIILETTQVITVPIAEVKQDASTDQTIFSGLSKNARKRLLKEKRWIEGKADRKAKFKQEREAMRQKRLAEGLSANPSRKKNKIDQENSGIRIAIDCNFEKYMTDQEIKSTIVQLGFCYSVNRKQPKRLDLSATSFTPLLQKLMAERTPTYSNWRNFEFHSGHYSEVYEPTNCVYLTADSPNTLQELDPTKVYIVGGIVDRNRHKSLCFNDALKTGVSHAKLPLSSYVDMPSRKVLTINHVVEILVNYANSGNWEDAFLKVLPVRKGAKSKASESIDENGSNGDESEEHGSDKDNQECLNVKSNSQNDESSKSIEPNDLSE
ncbi:tRNA (guanine(9)-N(1))-methyltransferase [Batrachochytrium dendrobatidis]